MALATDYEAENLLRASWSIPSMQDGSIAPILRFEAEAEAEAPSQT
jgi:hypothetical protein